MKLAGVIIAMPIQMGVVFLLPLLMISVISTPWTAIMDSNLSLKMILLLKKWLFTVMLSMGDWMKMRISALPAPLYLNH